MAIHVSRCSLGKDRWFWCAWEADAIYEGLPPIHSGYASSALAAEEASRKKYPDANSYPANFAKHAHYRQVQQNRKPNNEAKDTKPVEYLYTDYCSDHDGSEMSFAHHIIKKTKKCVFVLDDNGRTRRLDREKLETEGSHMGRGWWDVYHTTPIEERRGSYQPQWAVILGVNGKASETEIAKAYRRRVLESHPDRGGDPEEFKAVQTAWESIHKQMKGLFI